MELSSQVKPYTIHPDQKTGKPLVTVILAAYNEAQILQENLKVFVETLKNLEEKYHWELIVVNDGSHDATGELLEDFAQKEPRLIVAHHHKNRGLGAALQTGFSLSKGDYVVTLDIDLSCSPKAIKTLLDKIEKSGGQVVVYSPTMKGGEIQNVPWHRKQLSYGANRFLSFFSSGKVSNFTCMTRAYNGAFIRSLHLRSSGMEIMPEILYKTMIMDGKIEEIPGILRWHEEKETGRVSKMRIFQHTLATLFSGFLLRPFLFFILPGIFLLLFSFYPNIWMVIHVITEYQEVAGNTFIERGSQALRVAYQLHPHTFLTGLLSLLLALQIIALGIQSLQSKHYYEELFSMLTAMNRKK